MGIDSMTLKMPLPQKLAHAYHFVVPDGVGKTTSPVFYKTINCMSLTADGEACNACESCVAFNEQRYAQYMNGGFNNSNWMISVS